MKALIKYLTFVLTLSLLVGCSQEFAPNPGSLLDTDQSPFALREDDEGGDEGAGNNLSLPVIWADGSLSLRHDLTEPPILKGEMYDLDGQIWYLQNDPENAWQAFNGDGEEFEIHGPIGVTYVDWGDNLEAKAWPASAIIRVETRLYRTLDIPQKTYEMAHLYGEGIDEVWGTNGKEFLGEEATIYSDKALLAIQRIDKEEPASPDPADIHWDMKARQWVGQGVLDLEPIVWEPIATDEGPGGYSAEVNVAGVVIFGYNWDMKRTKYEPGVYRITFHLGNGNAWFTGDSYIKAFSEEEPELFTEDDDGSSPNIPGYAEIRPGLNLTYIDVMIADEKGGGGGGGGNGGGGHTGGSNVSHGNTGNGGQGGHGNH